MQARKNMYIHKQVTIKQKIHGKFYKCKFTNSLKDRKQWSILSHFYSACTNIF